MTLEAVRNQHDPITWLLMFIDAAQRQSAALRDPLTAIAALGFFQTELPGYRQLLEQALFPLLKRRLRDDTDEREEDLRRSLFLASGTLLTWVERLPELAAHPHDALPYSHRIQTFSSDLDQHLETMQTVILPAVHTRLSECGLGLLARSLDRSRPQHAACTPDHSPENGHNA